MTRFAAPIAEQIWDMKYRLKEADGTPIDATIEETWSRVAKSLASVEKKPSEWEPKFYKALEDFRYLPAGRITAGAGTDRSVTLFNCFVMGTIPDTMSGIFDNLREAALTMQQGGGIGYDFSTIRPKGAVVKGVAADASGPLSFMDVWDAMCRTIMSAGSRRGAMMATMRCDHPDVEDFITAKSDAARLRMFNMSVLVTDPFMEAVKADGAWDLVWDGDVVRTVQARALWDSIMQSTYSHAEPGVIFIDRINTMNNLNYVETIAATNPCGEQPLPPYGACLLGSVNLARLVHFPFEAAAKIDDAELTELVATAVRMMDNVVDASRFPLEAQAKEAAAKRRIGLGVTGLADALLMTGLRYGSQEAARQTEHWMKAIARAAYLASVDLAKEKGAFPLYSHEYLDSEFIQTLPRHIIDMIEEYGIRNSHLLSIAPTGTISLCADNISSGCEPVFSYQFERTVQQFGGERTEVIKDYAYGEWGVEGKQCKDVTVAEHLQVLWTAQRYVDSAVSKTCNLPADISWEAFKEVYMTAWAMGCKGCTTFRNGGKRGGILVEAEETVTEDTDEPAPACYVDPVTGRSECE